MKKTILEGVFSQAGKPQTDEQQSLSVKAPYEAPVTLRTLVETEGSFCGSVIDQTDPETQTGMKTSEHGFASTPDAEGNVPNWEVNLGDEKWD